jgi:hypothetical protein
MAFTRFHDDANRIKKTLDESTFAGRYALDTPGPGLYLPFYADPQMRLQKTAANMRTNTIGIENDLRGMTRKLNRDLVGVNDYISNREISEAVTYTEREPFVLESRASHPAWMYRNVDVARWEEPFLDPQASAMKGFVDQVSSRIIEKDAYVLNLRM